MDRLTTYLRSRISMRLTTKTCRQSRNGEWRGVVMNFGMSVRIAPEARLQDLSTI